MFRLKNLGMEQMDAALMSIAILVSRGKALELTQTSSLLEEYEYQSNLVANLVFRYPGWQYQLCNLVNKLYNNKEGNIHLLRYLGAYSNATHNTVESTIFSEGFEVQNYSSVPMSVLEITLPNYPPINYVSIRYAWDFKPYKEMSRVSV